MHKLYLLILLVSNVICDEKDSNEKYIDLLPEEEKQEFLNRIARRILEGIKSGDTPSESHTDITDDQLDAHDAYVQEVLNEESKNFKNERARQVSENKEEIEDHERFDSNNGNNGDHMDLILRDGKRKKRKNSYDITIESTTELSYNIIPVKTVYDQPEINDIVKNGTSEESNNNTNLVREYEENIVEDIRDREESTSDMEGLNPQAAINKTDNVESIRKPYEGYKVGTTLITDFEPNLNEHSPTTDDYNIINDVFTPTPISNEFNNNTTTREGTLGFIQNIYAEDRSSKDNEESHVKGITEVYRNSTSDEILQTESNKVTTISVDVIETSNNDTIADPITKTVTFTESSKHANDISRSESNNKEHSLKDNETENFTETTVTMDTIPTVKTSLANSIQDYAIVTRDVLTGKENLGVTEDTSFQNSNVFTTDVPEVTNVEILRKRGIVQTNFADNPTTLRTGQDNSAISEIDDKKSFENVDANIKKKQFYEVYEVDANKPQFMVTGKTKIKDHPYYIPVYNYATDNTYFKPYNKFGPNVDDVESNSQKSDVVIDESNKELIIDLPIVRHRFSGYNNKESGHNTRNTKNVIKKQNVNLFDLTRPIKPKLFTQNINYNPYDYPDIDYYFGRVLRRGKHDDVNNIHFPNSNELDHPISSIHKSDTVKDHVRAIRKLLYLQKLFGYVPKESKTTVRKANQYLKSSKNTPKKDISVDYYYNRDDSKEKDANSRVFRISKSSVKSINPNISPLTPNPLEYEVISESEQSKKQIDLNDKVHNEESPNPKLDGITFNDLFESMLIVLEDTITLDNENIIKYDWLKTTVNIQAAIKKLIDVIDKLQHGSYVHPKDIELIKYTLYLFKSSNVHVEGGLKNQNLDGEVLADKEAQRANKNKNKKDVLPKTNRIIKEPLKLWMDFAAYIRRLDEVDTKGQKFKLLYVFRDMLESFLFYLNDLHDAVKHIAMITKYRHQAWYHDLKDVYLKKANNKHLAQVILHLSLSRLLDLIEDSARSGVEESFRAFVKNNKEAVERSKEESLFALNVLAELRRMDT